jgi:uncharacterized protein YjeT (DUF2065 family)
LSLAASLFHAATLSNFEESMSFIPRLMGIMPFGIGLTVLFFIWFGDVRPFGGAPLVFRVFASFVAMGFVLTGLMIFKAPSLLKSQHQNMLDRVRELSKAAGHDLVDSSATPDGRSQVNYSCPNCGARTLTSRRAAMRSASTANVGSTFIVKGRTRASGLFAGPVLSSPLKK